MFVLEFPVKRCKVKTRGYFAGRRKLCIFHSQAYVVSAKRLCFFVFNTRKSYATTLEVVGVYLKRAMYFKPAAREEVSLTNLNVKEIPLFFPEEIA